jgi:hypothetical protein
MQLGSQFIDAPARQAIDDAGAAAHSLRQQLTVRGLVLGAYPIEKIRPVETCHMHGRIAELELRDDVGTHARRGGRGEGEQRDFGMAPSQPGELTVLGSKIMPPFRYAVRLVDDEGVDADT